MLIFGYKATASTVHWGRLFPVVCAALLPARVYICCWDTVIIMPYTEVRICPHVLIENTLV